MTYKWPPAPTLRMSYNTYVDEMICRINDHSNELYCHIITAHNINMWKYLTSSDLLSWFRRTQENGCSGWKWLLLGNEVLGYLPGADQPGQDLQLLTLDRPDVLLLLWLQGQDLGHQCWSHQEEEEKPLCSEEERHALRGLPQQAKATPFSCEIYGRNGATLSPLLWPVWLHQCFWKGAEAAQEDEAWKATAGRPAARHFSLHTWELKEAYQLQRCPPSVPSWAINWQGRDLSKLWRNAHIRPSMWSKWQWRGRQWGGGGRCKRDRGQSLWSLWTRPCVSQMYYVLCPRGQATYNGLSYEIL